jgi:hypothetical protein
LGNEKERAIAEVVGRVGISTVFQKQFNCSFPPIDDRTDQRSEAIMTSGFYIGGCFEKYPNNAVSAPRRSDMKRRGLK